MNNKGQVLVLFILLLPVLFILFAYAIDKCYLLYQENSQKNIGNIVCSYLTDINKTYNDGLMYSSTNALSNNLL